MAKASILKWETTLYFRLENQIMQVYLYANRDHFHFMECCIVTKILYASKIKKKNASLEVDDLFFTQFETYKV